MNLEMGAYKSALESQICFTEQVMLVLWVKEFIKRVLKEYGEEGKE